jgi:hypothetical protein
MLSIVRPTINVVSLRQAVSSVILPPLGTGPDFAGCLQWNEPEVSGHGTMDAVSGTRPAKAEGVPSIDAQRSNSTGLCGATIFRGKDDRCASERTKLGSRPNTAGRDLERPNVILHIPHTAIVGLLLLSTLALQGCLGIVWLGTVGIDVTRTSDIEF